MVYSEDDEQHSLILPQRVWKQDMFYNRIPISKDL
jgi:hypothetical protein